jgi:post-segregation antitoxin (ccd killing protein)
LSTIVLSIRIPRELKKAIEKYGIDVKKVIEKALEEEVRKIRKRRFKELVDKALSSTDLTIEDWVESIREDRRR